MVFTKIRHTRMNTYTHLAFVYLNGAKHLLQFRVSEDITLIDMKFKLNTRLRNPENQRVIKLEYHSPLIDDERKIWFTKLELKMDEDLKVMKITFYRYSSKGLIEVDALVVRSTEDIVTLVGLS